MLLQPSILFLLSVLDYPPEDVAFMSDDEIAKIMANQVVFETPQGTVLVNRSFVVANLDKFLFVSPDK